MKTFQSHMRQLFEQSAAQSCYLLLGMNVHLPHWIMLSTERYFLSKGKGRKWCWHTVNNWQEHPSSVLLHLWYKKCTMTTNRFCVIGSVLQGRSGQGQEIPPLIIVSSFPILGIHSTFHHKLGKCSRSWSIIQTLPITSTGFHDDYGGNSSKSSYTITNKPFFHWLPLLWRRIHKSATMFLNNILPP